MSENKIMTCENCLHYDICNEKAMYNFRYMGVPFQASAYMYGVDESCKHFIESGNLRKKDYMEDAIYPLVIISDRYDGAYSGGKYTAWNVDFDEIPSDIDSDDVWCHNFWHEQEENPTYFVGKGDTVSEALADLYIKLKSAGIITG